MRQIWLIGLIVFIAGCNINDDEAKKAGVCIHGTTVTPKGAGCGACVGGSPTCDNKYYTYCTDEKKSDDCRNLSASCSVAGPTFAVYDDVITYYDGGKKCDTSGYSLTCPSNSSYKAASLSFCPP